jgi:hypothetical protein
MSYTQSGSCNHGCRWWDKYASRTGSNFLLITPSDSRCLVRSEFPGATALASVNASRPVYTDDPKCIEKWKKLYNTGGTPAVRKAVVEALQSVQLQQVQNTGACGIHI